MEMAIKKYRSCFALSLLAIAVSQAVHAVEDTAALGEVVISASRSDTKLADMPLHTTVLTREQIEQSPAQTVDQLLLSMPGFNMSAGVPGYVKDPTGQAMSMRGLGSNGRTLLLLDGTPLQDTFYGTALWSHVPKSSIERIEVVHGGGATQWGNMAMAGVVNIVTRKPKGNSGEISGGIGAQGTSDIGVAKNFLVSDAVKLRLTADNFLTQGYLTIPSVPYAPASNVKFGQGDSYARNSNVGMQAYFTHDETLSSYVRTGFHDMKDLSSSTAIALNTTLYKDVAGGLNKKLDEHSQLEANAFYRDTNFNKNNSSNAATTAYINANYVDLSTDAGVSALWRKDMASTLSQLMFGVDYRSITGSNATTNFNTNGSLNSTAYGKGTQDFAAVFGQTKLDFLLIFPTEVTAGGRYTQWASRVDTVNSQKAGQPLVGSAVPNLNRGYFDPSIALRMEATNDLAVRAAAYKAFHAPGLNNMYRSYGSNANWNFSNPNLVPETMLGGEMGVDYQWRSGMVKVTLFDNYVQDAIVNSSVVNAASKAQLCGGAPGTAGSICTTAGSTVKQLTNNQNLRSVGLEIEAHHKLNDVLSFDLALTDTDTWLTWTNTPDPIKMQLAGIPNLSATAGVNWRALPRLNLNIQSHLFGRSWMDSQQLVRVNGYGTLDFKANYTMANNIEVFGSVQNLFNRYYIATGSTGASLAAGTIGMPRALFVGANYRF